MDHLDFSCHAGLYRCMYVSCQLCQHQKVNLCFSKENAMTDFRKTWYVLHEVCLGPRYLQVLPGISSCFEKDLPHCFQNVFMCPLTNHFAYYQLHRNKSKFLDYISESFLRKGISWIVGILPFPVYMIIEYNSVSLFGFSIWVWHLKLCISFVWKYENVIKLLLLRVARKILKCCYCSDRNIYQFYNPPPPSWLDYFCDPPIFHEKKSMTP